MARRKVNKNKKLSLMVIMENLITEIFDSTIETEFKEIPFDDYIAYRFKTNSGNEYDLEFHYSEEDSTTIINHENGTTLGDILNKTGMIDCFDIAFTLTSVENKDNPDEFELETNLNEVNELFGRISYIIQILLKKYKKIKLFVIGSARRNRLKIYEKIFENHFSNEFKLFYGESQYHVGKSLFLIRI